MSVVVHDNVCPDFVFRNACELTESNDATEIWRHMP